MGISLQMFGGKQTHSVTETSLSGKIHSDLDTMRYYNQHSANSITNKQTNNVETGSGRTGLYAPKN